MRTAKNRSKMFFVGPCGQLKTVFFVVGPCGHLKTLARIFFRKTDLVDAINLVQKSSKSELSSRFLSRSKFWGAKKVEFSKGRLPPEDGSVRPQTLGKRVSDDSQHFIFRRRKIGKNFWWKFSSKNKNRRKIDKLPVFAELWIFGRNRQMCLEKLPPKFWFSTLYDFWRRGKRDSFNFCPDFRPKMTSILFVLWLEDKCVPDDKISAAWWLVGN